jgi:FtsP/CotA-like multicopper oxidase with cupredoxin domain
MRTQAVLSLVLILAAPPACTRTEDEAARLGAQLEAGLESAVDFRGPDLPVPPVARSTNGTLAITLTAAPAEISVADQTFTSNVYNGMYIPPVLRVRRGDDIRVTFVNAVDSADILIEHPQPSNVHYHGMEISPLEPVDNIYISVPSSASTPRDSLMTVMAGRDSSLLKSSAQYEYRWTVPADHGQGPYWYHPHRDPFLEAQVLSGMSGMLVIEGLIEEQYPELASAEVRTLILKDIALPDAEEGAERRPELRSRRARSQISGEPQLRTAAVANRGPSRGRHRALRMVRRRRNVLRLGDSFRPRPDQHRRPLQCL